MTIIKQEDFIQSIADAFQFISYYHPVDYIKALSKAWEKEENPAAKDAMTQILVNSRMCAEGHRPICQDTGIATVFLKVGMNVQWDAQMSVQEMVNEGVRRAYTNPDNKLRASVLADPAGKRQNTKDNTPRRRPHGNRGGRQNRSNLRGQRRRFGKQIQNGHAQPVRQASSIGF